LILSNKFNIEDISDKIFVKYSVADFMQQL